MRTSNSEISYFILTHLTKDIEEREKVTDCYHSFQFVVFSLINSEK